MSCTADEYMEGNAVPRGAIMQPESHDDSGLHEEHIGIIIGTLAALILVLSAVALFIVIRNKVRKQSAAILPPVTYMCTWQQYAIYGINCFKLVVNLSLVTCDLTKNPCKVYETCLLAQE